MASIFAGLFTGLWTGLFAGLLSLPPVPQNPFPETLVANVSGHFTAGGMVAVQLQPNVSLEVDGQSVDSHKGVAIFGYGRDRKGKSKLVFTTPNGAQVFYKNLQPRVYDIQYVEGVAPKYVTPPKNVLARIKAEGQTKRAARLSRLRQPDLTGGFIWPVKGRISGVYGAQRFFNGQPKRPHYGVDIVAPKGTPVKATRAGRVTLAAADMYYEGGLVFIDHGLGLVSAYLHLSALHVRVGQMVQGGDIIGEVGTGGRSTGAHLDWRIYWHNERLDPALLVAPMEK